MKGIEEKSMANKWQRWSGIMKAYPFEENRLAKWKPPYIVQPKYDGDRGVDHPQWNGNHLLVTSEDNPVWSVPHINEALLNLNCPKRLDGEFYNHDIFLEGGHELIHSIVSRTVNFHPRYKEMEFHIFDYQDMKKPQMARTIELDKLREKIKTPLVISPYWICNSLDEVKRVYDEIIGMKYEGIIVRNIYGMYEIDKRSRWMMKFKPKKKDTYSIIGWKEETTMEGVPKGRIGSLLMSSQTGDEFSVSAGLGFDEKNRLWKIRDKLSEMSAVVHYQHLTNKQIPKGTFDVEVIEDES